MNGDNAFIGCADTLPEWWRAPTHHPNNGGRRHTTQGTGGAAIRQESRVRVFLIGTPVDGVATKIVCEFDIIANIGGTGDARTGSSLCPALQRVRS